MQVPAATAGANGQGQGSAKQIAAAINQVEGQTGVTATANATTATITAANISSAVNFTDVVGTDDSLVFHSPFANTELGEILNALSQSVSQATQHHTRDFVITESTASAGSPKEIGT